MAQLGAKLFIKKSLSYKEACRLFIVSATPSVVLLFASLTANFATSYAGLVILALIVFYFSFAVYTVKQEGNQVVVS